MPTTLHTLSYLAAQTWAMHGPTLDQARALLLGRASGARPDAAFVAGVRESARDRRGGVERIRRTAARDEPVQYGFDGLEAIDEGSDGDADPRPLYLKLGALSIVPAHGMFAKYSSMVHGISGPEGMSTNRLQQAIRAAILDRQTRQLMLDVDSPGGTVAGMEDVIELLRQNREGAVRPDGYRVPVSAMCHDLAASGGFLLSAWADQVFAHPSAKVGYMGVYRVLVDSSAAAGDEGISCEIISSKPGGGGESVKGAGEPGTLVTEAMREAAQNEVDALGRWYAATVAEGRGMPFEQINRLCDGRGWVGEAAVEAGLVDSITTLPELVKVLRAAADAVI